MRAVLTGNEAAAYAAKLARVQVISAYPITPQTVVVEKLSEFIANGELDAEFIKVESEHSAMSACIGAAAAGARAFTATSSQGLMLMSEMLFVAAGLRLPIVMTNANRSLSAPLSIWCDQQDSMVVRDSGWIQIYCENNQEILDSTIQAFRIAEKDLLPVMVCYDGYILSHTAEPVDIPDQRDVDRFLPPYRYPYSLDPEKPVTLGAVGTPPYYTEFRYMLHQALLNSKKTVREVGAEFGKAFGRPYSVLETYHSEDAEVILITLGSLAGPLKEMVDTKRERGERIGLVRLRLFRPFPVEELVSAVEHAKAVGVLEKDISLGSAGGLYLDVSNALVSRGISVPMIDFVCGLAGRDVSPRDLNWAMDLVARAKESGKVQQRLVWLGLRKELLGGGDEGISD
jgi:pyruvate ferredoxin oxidoreductase alpha subunit